MIIIYKITNTITNKSYIGYTKHTLEKRWSQHVNGALKTLCNRKFYNSIRSHGVECWKKEIIEEVENVNIGKEKEIFYIDFFNTYDQGYNSTKGGDGNNGIIMNEESNRKRSLALKGKKKSKEHAEKLRSRRHTEETKNKISESHKGKKKPWVIWTPERIRKRSISRRALNEEQYDLIHKYRNEKMTIKEISNKLNMSPGIIKKWSKIKAW